MRNVDGPALTLYGEKEKTDIIYACRINNSYFNFTTNFSILSGSGRDPLGNDMGAINSFEISSSYTGHDGIDYISGSSTIHGEPHTFITGVTLFDNYGVPVATAALSTPLKKSFDKEVLIKVKLEF